MIELLLEDYCQEGCRMFKPVLSAQKDIYIKCEWASQCRYLKNYLKRTGKTDEDETDKETEGTDY